MRMLIVLAALLLLVVKFWPKGLWLVLTLATALVCSVLYFEHLETKQLDLIKVTVTYDDGLCPAERPLAVTITNNGQKMLDRLQFNIRARMPGYSDEITPYTHQQYDSSKILNPGESHTSCYPKPRLSYRAVDLPLGELEWSGEAARVYFR